MEQQNTLPLLHKDDAQGPIGQFEAVFPQFPTALHASDPTRFIKIISQASSAVLKVSKRRTGDAIIVARSTLDGIPDGEPVFYVEGTALGHYWYRVRNDTSQKIALFGLFLAFVGAGFDTGVAIGKFYPQPALVFSQEALAGWTVVALVLKLAGLLLVFYKGLLDAK